MHIWQAIVLGAVQGFAEFLPISSSGHLILMQRWLGLADTGMFFDIMLHIGTLIPVFIVLWKEFLELFKKPFSKLLFLIVATIPAGITGFLLGDKIEYLFYGSSWLSVILLAITFILTATELFFAEIIQKKRQKSLPINLRTSAIMGLFQSIAIVPGLSRSGTVISGGCYVGVKREENASFAFLMSIPVILGAALVSGYKAIKTGAVIEIAPVIAGVITAALTGYIAIKVMLSAIKKANYKWFSLYLIIIAILSILSKILFNA